MHPLFLRVRDRLFGVSIEAVTDVLLVGAMPLILLLQCVSVRTVPYVTNIQRFYADAWFAAAAAEC